MELFKGLRQSLRDINASEAYRQKNTVYTRSLRKTRKREKAKESLQRKGANLITCHQKIRLNDDSPEVTDSSSRVCGLLMPGNLNEVVRKEDDLQWVHREMQAKCSTLQFISFKNKIRICFFSCHK